MTMPTGMGMLSPDLRCHWAGWVSDARTLQRHGWEFSAERMAEYDAERILMRHREGGVYGHATISRQQIRYGENPYERGGSIGFMMDFHMAREIVMQMLEPVNFVPVVPRSEVEIMTAMKHQRISNSDFFFRRLPPRSEDVKVIPPTFDEILDIALEHQAPKQKEIRAKMMDRKRRESSGLIITCAA